MAVAIDGEFFSAGWTSKDVDGLPLHQIKVAVPPLIPASVTAEPFPLPSGILCNGLTTAFTYRFSISGNYQIVSPTE